MWRTLLQTRVGSSIAALAGFCIVATVILYGILYATAEIPFSRRLLGWLVTSAWTVAPYAAVIGMTWLFAGIRAAPSILLACTALMAGLAAVVAVEAGLSPHDGQAGMALLAVPILQWLMLTLAIGASFAVKFLRRNGTRS